MIILKCIVGFFQGIAAAVIALIVGAILFHIFMVVYGFSTGDWSGTTYDKFSSTAMNVGGPWCFVVFPIIGSMLPMAKAVRDTIRQYNLEQAQRLAREESAKQKLANLAEVSTAIAQNLDSLISAAEEHLDRAEEEFSERAFAPFWDAIEEAIKVLAKYNSDINRLMENAEDYSQTAATLSHEVPTFNLAVSTVPSASNATKRMRAVVRRAQTDFQFANIFELRKNNKILVAGFSSLGRAISELGDQIDSSLESLGCRNEIATATAGERMVGFLSADSETRRAHEAQVREMLDNIQKGKRPRS